MLNKKEASTVAENIQAVNELMAKAKKRGMVTYREIMDSLQDVELNCLSRSMRYTRAFPPWVLT
jgi:hypothetical protein